MPSSASERFSTTVESKCENVVAGAGSVRSSAGTYTACTLVMEPFLVEVMRSCMVPISWASVGWYPTAEGMRPRSADTSLPACVKRNTLSMKNSTSWPSLSRKCSAMVSPVRPTRMRAPGGSFIWPKTMATLSSTPEFFISW